MIHNAVTIARHKTHWPTVLVVSLALHGLALVAFAHSDGAHADEPRDIVVDLVMVPNPPPKPSVHKAPEQKTARSEQPRKRARHAPKRATRAVRSTARAKPSVKRQVTKRVEKRERREPVAADVRSTFESALADEGQRAVAFAPKAPRWLGGDALPNQHDGSAMVSDRNARATYAPQPRYPLSARRMGIVGRVLLRVQVDAQGRVKATQIATSSGFDVLDEAAKKAVMRWKFAAASRSGRSIASWVRVPIRFRMQ
jgi:protein TonB